MVKTLNFQDKGCSMIPGWGIKIPRALRWGQKKKKKVRNSTYGGKGMCSKNTEDVHSGCEWMEMEGEERMKDDS